MLRKGSQPPLTVKVAQPRRVLPLTVVYGESEIPYLGRLYMVLGMLQDVLRLSVGGWEPWWLWDVNEVAGGGLVE